MGNCENQPIIQSAQKDGGIFYLLHIFLIKSLYEI